MKSEEHCGGFEEWARERARHFEWYAETSMPPAGREPKRLVGSMRYAVLGGGKRLRPLLCYAAGETTGADGDLLDRAALALEMIHSYSLVHDDMPAMDNDTLRRGRPTVHVRYGEALAMLAGDALQSQAFCALAESNADPARIVRLTALLARAAGPAGMCGGQALDLALVGRTCGEEELARMQSMKTGALILASLLMGAQAGRWEALGARAQSGFVVYGRALGLAFQVVDDILDCTQDTATLGKTAGKDEKDDKPTWVSFLGLEGAKARAESLLNEALEALALIGRDPAVEAGALRRLEEIAHYVTSRTH